MEQKWQSEVDDAMQGKLENNMPFFYDYHFNEVSKLYDSSLGIAVCHIGLAKNFAQVFLLTSFRKPKRTFWPAQYFGVR